MNEIDEQQAQRGEKTSTTTWSMSKGKWNIQHMTKDEMAKDEKLKGKRVKFPLLNVYER